MMKLQVFAVCVAVLCAAVLTRAQEEASDDANFFDLLYSKISDIIAPGAGAAGTGKPSEVFLMELPGLAIAREDLDPDFWADDGFRRRMPMAVLADFVDRLPRYWDTTFVDSGTRVSAMWKNLMSQYLVPVIDNPVQTEAVEAARFKLENSTIEEDFFSALQDYEDALDASLTERQLCLHETYASEPELCAAALIPDYLRLRMTWFSMETRRRDLVGAHATILALQMTDLKSLYAESLADFEGSRLQDMGASGHNQDFYQTFAVPSNFWTWWPLSTSSYDVVVDSGVEYQDYTWGDVSAALESQITADVNVTVTMRNADITYTQSGFRITPAIGYSGSDSFTVDPDNGGTLETVVSVGITGAAGEAADAAFVTVSSSSSESSSSSSYSTSSLSVSARARVNYGLFKASANFNYGSSSTSSSFSSSSSKSEMTFSIAKVSINRPWLDTSLLTYKPVAIRGLGPGEWSDGSGRPSSSTKIRFPLLPTAFIVARNIYMYSESWGSLSTFASQASSSSTSVKVKYGPFFSGSAKVSTSSYNQEAHQESTFENDALDIPGPQVIGWVCQPMPFFPTASSAQVEKINFGQVITDYSAA